jgi:hypothetical protein
MLRSISWCRSVPALYLRSKRDAPSARTLSGRPAPVRRRRIDRAALEQAVSASACDALDRAVELQLEIFEARRVRELGPLVLEEVVGLFYDLVGHELTRQLLDEASSFPKLRKDKGMCQEANSATVGPPLLERAARTLAQCGATAVR